MIVYDETEALRYLGYRSAQPDEAMVNKMQWCADGLQQVAQPRSVYREFPLAHLGEDVLRIVDVEIHSKNLARNLKSCTQVYLMAATLGIGVDRVIARASAVSISDAVIYQAVAAAMVEAYCDECNDEIRNKAATQGLYCRPRYSPGYGDFQISHQHDFSRLLDTPRRIGLTVTDSCLLAPIKSVTAIIGLSETQEPCHRKGCEVCDKTDCAFRR